MPPRAQPPSPRRAITAHMYKQYPGQQQVDLSVKIDIPGSYFSAGSAGGLTAGERKEKYEAIAMEYEEEHILVAAAPRKPAKIAPCIRAVFPSDAADDAEHPGFWIELRTWNRYRHDTYKDRPDDEVRLLRPHSRSSCCCCMLPRVSLSLFADGVRSGALARSLAGSVPAKGGRGEGRRGARGAEAEGEVR